MSKKNKYVCYVVASKIKATPCDTWDEAKRLRDSVPGSTILGGYLSQEEAEAAAGVYNWSRAEAEKKTTENVVESYGSCWFDIYADGFYEQGRYTGTVVVYEGRTMVRKVNITEVPNEAKRHGKWAALLPAIVAAVRWSIRDHKLDGVIVHVACQGPQEWVTGAWKANETITQEYVRAMEPFKPFVRFAPVPATSVEDLERFQLVNELALLINKSECSGQN